MVEKAAVLLVDDSPVLLNLNKKVLTQEGYRVLTARSLKEAREQAALNRPSAAVLDVVLPDGSGLDYCRELRAKDIPVVFLTALGGAEYEKAGYCAGASDYIVKPFRIEELVASLGSALAARAGKDRET